MCSESDVGECAASVRESERNWFVDPCLLLWAHHHNPIFTLLNTHAFLSCLFRCWVSERGRLSGSTRSSFVIDVGIFMFLPRLSRRVDRPCPAHLYRGGGGWVGGLEGGVRHLLHPPPPNSPPPSTPLLCFHSFAPHSSLLVHFCSSCFSSSCGFKKSIHASTFVCLFSFLPTLFLVSLSNLTYSGLTHHLLKKKSASHKIDAPHAKWSQLQRK
jgi:hypothetical protein